MPAAWMGFAQCFNCKAVLVPEVMTVCGEAQCPGRDFKGSDAIAAGIEQCPQRPGSLAPDYERAIGSDGADDGARHVRPPMPASSAIVLAIS